MKKIMLLLTAILIAALAFVYLWIPGKLLIQNGIAINCTSAAGARFL